MAIVDGQGVAMKFAFSSGDRPLDGFTIKRGLGTGGFGEVYYALTDAGKEVALKHVRRHQEIERRGVSQCLNLKHANLVGVYDIREDSHGDTWIVMEYIADGSLRDALNKRPTGLPPEEVRRWFEGMAAGLGLLHDRGLVHRDLKPGNVFQDEGVVKIGDYGLSKLLSSSQVGGQTESVGTFHYTAPEVSRGSYGRSVDIYSLGVILYEMLTGDVPFDGESAQEIIMKHLTATPDWNRVPAVFRPVLEHALAKDPAQRYPNVAEFARAVSGALAGEPIVEATWVEHPGAAAGAAFATSGATSGANAPHAADAPHAARGFHGFPGADQPSPRTPNFFDDEPIYQLGLRLSANVQRWLTDARIDNTSRTILLVVIVAVAYFNAAWIIPLGTLAAMVYAVYLGARWCVWTPSTGGALPTAARAGHRPYNAGPVAYGHAGQVPPGDSASVNGAAGYGPPGHGVPGYGVPGYGVPSYGAAGYPAPNSAPPGNTPPHPSPANAAFPQAAGPGYPQPGYPQPGYPQPGYPQPGYPQPGYPQPGYPQPGVLPAGQLPPGSVQPSYPLAGSVPPPAPRTKRPLRVSVRAMVQRQTMRERFRELSGSWLMSALIAAFLAGIGTLLFDGRNVRVSASSSSLFPDQPSSTQLVDMAARAVWLWGGTTIGAWLLLTLGKLWEKDSGSVAHRRLAMSLVGVLLGCAVAGLANYLGLNRSPLPRANVPLLAELLPLNIQSPWVGYPLLYGILFLVLRWWREADSLRSARFSYWNTIVDVAAAFAVAQFVSVGNVGQLFLPAAISISVQLSAPWIDLEARARFREQATGEAVT